MTVINSETRTNKIEEKKETMRFALLILRIFALRRLRAGRSQDVFSDGFAFQLHIGRHGQSYQQVYFR